MAAASSVLTAAPAAASYPCPGGWSCYYDTDPYRGSAEWRAPSCGDHDLRNIGWSDRISYAANWGGGKADLYNWDWFWWDLIDTVPVGTGARSYAGKWQNNITDRIIIQC
jgi:hypothetical protein